MIVAHHAHTSEHQAQMAQQFQVLAKIVSDIDVRMDQIANNIGANQVHSGPVTRGAHSSLASTSLAHRSNDLTPGSKASWDNTHTDISCNPYGRFHDSGDAYEIHYHDTAEGTIADVRTGTTTTQRTTPSSTRATNHSPSCTTTTPRTHHSPAITTVLTPGTSLLRTVSFTKAQWS
jgi:hypothetical protein